MAYVRERTSGSYAVSYRDRNGRLVKDEKLPAKNLKEARRLAMQIEEREEKLRRGLAVDADPITFEKLWTEEMAPIAKGKRGFRSKESIIRMHALPALGKMLVGHIRPMDIEKLLTSKAGKLSPRTRDHLRVNISSVFTFAIKNKFIKENPATYVDPVPCPDPDPVALSIAQVSAIVRAAVADDIKLLIVTAALTAMRKGELLGLTWDNVDLEDRYIRVRKSYDGELKTKRSKRIVPIPRQLVPHLREARSASKSPYVFPDEKGGMRGPDFDVAAIFKTALKGAGFIEHWDVFCVSKGSRRGCGALGRVKPPAAPAEHCPQCGRTTVAKPKAVAIKFKDLRSTCITLLVEATGDLRAGQAIGGHTERSLEKVTGDRYSKIRDQHLRDQIDRTFRLPADSQPTTGTKLDEFGLPKAEPDPTKRESE